MDMHQLTWIMLHVLSFMYFNWCMILLIKSTRYQPDFLSKGGCCELRFFLYAGFLITINQVVCLCSSQPKQPRMGVT